MKQFRLPGIFFILILLINSCEKEPVLDKQIRLTFSGMGTGSMVTLDTTWQYFDNVRLIRFNKTNYPELKSIVFAADIGTFNRSNLCIIELYNITDSNAVAGSQIQSAKTYTGEFDFSENIIDALPAKSIDLTIRFKSTVQGQKALVHSDAYLFLER